VVAAARRLMVVARLHHSLAPQAGLAAAFVSALGRPASTVRGAQVQRVRCRRGVLGRGNDLTGVLHARWGSRVGGMACVVGGT
jgi:hypothetical protein